MTYISGRLGEKMTITITRWRACLLVSFATLTFAMAAQMVQRLIDSHRWFDVFELAVDGCVVALIMAFIFYVAGDEMVSPKQNSSKSS